MDYTKKKVRLSYQEFADSLTAQPVLVAVTDWHIEVATQFHCVALYKFDDRVVMYDPRNPTWEEAMYSVVDMAKVLKAHVDGSNKRFVSYPRQRYRTSCALMALAWCKNVRPDIAMDIEQAMFGTAADDETLKEQKKERKEHRKKEKQLKQQQKKQQSQQLVEIVCIDLDYNCFLVSLSITCWRQAPNARWQQ